MHPFWRVCGKNLTFVSMCAVSPVVHTSNTLVVKKKNFFSVPVAVNNSVKVSPLVLLFINVCNHGEHYETPCIALLFQPQRYMGGKCYIFNFKYSFSCPFWHPGHGKYPLCDVTNTSHGNTAQCYSSTKRWCNMTYKQIGIAKKERGGTPKQYQWHPRLPTPRR